MQDWQMKDQMEEKAVEQAGSGRRSVCLVRSDTHLQDLLCANA